MSQESYPSRDGGHLNTRQRPVNNPPSASQELPLVAPVCERYEIVEQISAGGMGTVWKARHRRLQALAEQEQLGQLAGFVALKRILPQYARDELFLKRFRRETVTVAGLQHPHIVPVHDFDEDADGPFLVMQWINGPDLGEVVKQDGPLDPQRAGGILAKVADALHAAHEKSITHRDIKPGNILLGGNDHPYLTDFGLAIVDAGTQAMMSRITLSGQAVGTPQFMPPEGPQSDLQSGVRGDIWSLGKTLYYITTGRLQIRDDRIPDLLRDVVTVATEEFPEDRYADMAEFAAALREGASRRLSGTTTVSRPAAVEPAAAVDNVETTPAPQPVEETDWAGMLKEMQSRVSSTVAQAERAVSEQQDYAEAVRLLETIPQHLRNGSRLSELQAQRDRVAALNERIEKGVREMRLAGLRGSVEELLQLQPHRQRLRELLATLPTAPVHPSLPPFDAATARRDQEAWSSYLGEPAEWSNSIGMKFRLVPPGEFLMGSPEDEAERSSDETRHQVRITKPFYCGVYPVTQGEYQRVTGSNPSKFNSVAGQDTSRFPVAQVNWEDAQQFLEQLNSQPNESVGRYRLATEAEWEYACRAGTTTPYWFGRELNGKLANCDGNYPYGTGKGPYLDRTSVVGSYGVNPFGLHDQHGNVFEWCSDWYAADWYSQSGADDPSGPSSGSSRVCRGGSWLNVAGDCRCAYRSNLDPSLRRNYIGFRVVREL
ncbi:MAG: SUMF1/EgtB/PvdO family nonheme iron enzyme [Rhodopirellula sp.]|nr:SUMF1/EgtB/PvdO family nonheme iron enzyme [Rhodopirellula sp.]